MNESESIDETLTYFTTITNGFCFLGDIINNYQKIRKIIRAFANLEKLKLLPSRDSMIRRRWTSRALNANKIKQP